MKLVEVRKLCKTYRNGVRANQDISLEVKAGELVGILGPKQRRKTAAAQSNLTQVVDCTTILMLLELVQSKVPGLQTPEERNQA
jgi:ABC-type Na+ transport system ATPase subunit NatA